MRRYKIKRSRIQILLQRGVVAGRRYREDKMVLERGFTKVIITMQRREVYE